MAGQGGNGQPGVAGNGAAGSGGQAGLGDAQQPGLGNQLSRRVSSGEISQEQAQQTAHDRAILEKAYGKNWRVKVFGDRGYTQRVRGNLSAGKDAEQNQALYKSLMEGRKKALEQAKAKLG